MFGTHVQNLSVVGVVIALSIAAWERVAGALVAEAFELPLPPPAEQLDSSNAATRMPEPSAVPVLCALCIICLS